MWGTHGAGRPRSASGPVHPHACGEHSGPSGEDGRRLRFIPTHVGNTPGGIEQRLTTAVHPHACGEHSCEAAGAQQTHGSSPRMWGTPGWLPPDPPRTRFIPTHVGNTAKTQARHCVPAVHPHACGEHWTSPYRSCRCGGSSPRMWGTPGAGAVGGSPRRFIPTHVGNTRPGRRPCRPGAVHPHACGEHASAASFSSQRARFIPTHVGNTLTVQNCF